MAASTYHLLGLAERAEALSAEVYAALAARFEADAEARALFVRLRDEEYQHASRIRLLAARYRHDSRLLGKTTVGIPELEELLRDGAGAIADIREGRWPDDLPGVKAELVRLERRLTRAHAEIIAQSGHEAVKDLFEQLAQQDEAHAVLLGEVTRRGRRARARR
jgi:rubrerythrin